MKHQLSEKYRNLVGDRIRKARLSSPEKISQEDLAGRLARKGFQMDRSAISRIESRSRYLMDYEIAAIAKILKKPVSWFFEEA